MTYEDAVKVFAASVFGVPVDAVVRAWIEMESGGGCPTCGDSASIDVNAELTVEPTTRFEKAHPYKGAAYYYREFYDVGEIIRPLVEIAAGPLGKDQG